REWLLLTIRHFAERTGVILWLTICLFSVFRMEIRLQSPVASVFDVGEYDMCIINEPETEIHFHQTTTSTPAQFIAGLTDFGTCRSRIFRNSADEYLKVHRRGRFEADVTEGSGGVWERLHYDWSDPNQVVLTTIDSNVWGGASGDTYTFTRQPDGAT